MPKCEETVCKHTECLKIIRIGKSAAKLRIGERSTTIPFMGVGLQAIGNPKW